MPRRKTRLGLVRGPARHRAAQAGLRASAPAPRRSRVSCERMPLEAAARPPTLAETGARRKEWCSQARRRPARALRPWSRLREAHNSPAEDVFRGKEMAGGAHMGAIIEAAAGDLLKPKHTSTCSMRRCFNHDEVAATRDVSERDCLRLAQLVRRKRAPG